ncbi:beta-ketoacyl synthase N-terminal-like domain-containing protein [Streptomyces sp. NPDC012389]|uniref:beta-ketoacyl synthase N-terminal-like domain-containing protein n=1 Tax=Streptomyces sp. NPDC012389 TaxID=3364830 RepID=UPI0036EE71D7
MSTAHPAAASPPRAAVVTGVGLAVPGLTLPDELLGTVREGGFDPVTGLVGRDLRHKDRASRLALRAAAPALSDAGLLIDGSYHGRGDTTAVLVSTNVGILENVCGFADTIARDTVLGLSPLGLPQTSSNVIAGSVAMAHGLRGPNVTLCNGPTSGLDALYWARALIVTGRADTAVVIGVEPGGDIVTKLLGAPALDGAVALVLESATRAAERGAKVRATVAGCARAADLAGAVARAGSLTPDLWLTEAADDPAAPPVASVLDPTAGLGAASGALGLLQAAAAIAHLDEHGRHTVLATCGGPEDDGVAAAFLTGPHHTP